MKAYLNQVFFFICFWCFYLLVYFLRIFFTLLPVRKKTAHKPHLKVMYLAAFFEENAGYHYRVAAWKKQLEAAGHEVSVKTVFRSQPHFNHCLQQPQRFLIRAMRLRLTHLLASLRYDRVVVRRSILLYNEYGNLFMEKLLLQIHPNAILDIDDDMERTDANQMPSLYGKLLLEKRDKFNITLNTYRKFIVGSHYLKEKVLTKNINCSPRDVVIVPTCVDYADEVPVSYNQLPSPLVIGWIGSNGNQHYLDDVIDGLNQLHKTQPLELLVISGKPYEHPDATFPIHFASWSLQSERALLQKITLGIMPLQDSPMERGKCGFKLIQYMGMGIVSIASAVGVNKTILEHGKNGFLVKVTSSWNDAFQEVMAATPHFETISKAARTTVANAYSFNVYKDKYLNFIQTCSIK